MAVEFDSGDFPSLCVEGKIQKNGFLAENQSLVADVQLLEYRKIFWLGILPICVGLSYAYWEFSCEIHE